MKKLLLLAIIAGAAFSNNANAQDVTSTKSNKANAQILGAIALTTVNDLEFGGIVPGTGGEVVMSVADVRTLTTVTGVTASVTPKSGAYTVTGTGNVAYTITIPTASFNITNTTGSGNETMAITAMLSSGGLSHAFAANGTDSFKVGGTLTVGANQAPGTYTGTFNVIVAY
jgi:hypothetical protein